MKGASSSLIATVAMIVLMLIGVGLFLALAFGSEENEGLINTFVSYGRWLVVIGFIGIIFSTIFGIVINPEQLRSVLVGVVAVLVVGGLSYILADGTVLPSFKGAVDESTSKLVSTGLNAFYIVSTLAILSLVYSFVSRLLK